MRYFYDL